MRKLVTIAAAIFLASAFCFNATAQTAANIKIGYTNVAFILSKLPESEAIESELRSYGTQLENQLQNKVKTLQEKYEAYEKGKSMMADAIKIDKEREIMDLQKQIEDFKQNADQSLRKKESELLEPVTERISKAIQEVAKDKGYTYIFNSDAGLNTTQILLYAPDDDNVTDLVIDKLKTMPATESKPATTTPAPKPTTAPAKKPAGK